VRQTRLVSRTNRSVRREIRTAPEVGAGRSKTYTPISV